MAPGRLEEVMMADTDGRPVVERNATTRANAGVIGGLILLFGILGFVPGAVSDFEHLQFVGNDGDVVLLGLFEVSGLHNLLHLVFGACGLLMARRAISAVGFLSFGGGFLLVMSLYGFFTSSVYDVNFIPLTSADSALHLVLGLIMVAMAVYGRAHLPLRQDDPLLPSGDAE